MPGPYMSCSLLSVAVYSTRTTLLVSIEYLLFKSEHCSIKKDWWDISKTN